MFCSNCGNKLVNEDLFCSGCGKKNKEKVISTPPEEGSVEFGKPILRGWGKFKPCSTLPSGYEWLQDRCTFIFYNRHFVAINADEKRSRFMDIIGNTGLPAGAAVISAGLTSLRAGLDKIKGNKFTFDTEAIDFLKSKKQIVWAKNEAVECWNYKRKPLLFYPVPGGWQLLCKLNIENTEYPCFLVCDCGPDVPSNWNKDFGISLQPTMSGFSTEKLFVNITKIKGIKDKELFSIMESDRKKYSISIKQ